MMLFALEFSDLGRWAQVIIGLGFVIFVHELGHFAVAKLCGVKCEKFYLGFDLFGLKLARFQWGETEYGIGAFPLGGYVKMLGQEDNPGKIAEELERARTVAAAGQYKPEAPASESNRATGRASAAGKGTPEAPASESNRATDRASAAATVATDPAFDPRSFWAKSVPKRMAIMSAGVVMNVLFAFALAAIAYGFGVEYTPCAVSGVAPGSAAWRADLRPGDQIVELAGIKNPRFEDLRSRVALSAAGATIDVHVLRPGQSEPFALALKPTIIKDALLPTLGLAPPSTTVLQQEFPVRPDSPAANAKPGFEEGDEIVAIDGEPVATYADIQRILFERIDQPLEFRVRRKNEKNNPASTTTEHRVTLGPSPRKTLGLTVGLGPIVDVQDQSPAAAAGLKVGDQIVSINGQPVGDPLDLNSRLAQSAGKDVIVEVRRSGASQPVAMHVTPRKTTNRDLLSDANTPASAPALGIAITLTDRIEAISPGSPAERAGLHVGDTLKRMALVPPAKVSEDDQAFFDALKGSLEKSRVNWDWVTQWLLPRLPRGTKIALTVNDRAAPLALEPIDATDAYVTDRGLLFEGDTRIRKAGDFAEACRLGFAETIEFLRQPYLVLQRIVTGRLSYKVVSGPVGIVGMAGQAARSPVVLILFLAMLSANLAVLNFLPVPVLDGGHMIFLALEGIRGKPVSERVFLVASYVGLLLILTLIVSVTVVDVGRLWP